MSESGRAPFDSIVAELCSIPSTDPIKSHLNGTIVVPIRIRPLIAALYATINSVGTTLIITPTHSQAASLAGDLPAFLESSQIELLPAWETLPFERISPSIEVMGHRSRVLARMKSDDKPRIVVASIRAVIQKNIEHQSNIVELSVGQEINRDELIAQLIGMGYSREYQVESRGECAVRGSIVDIYPSTENHPVRIELWGDTIERMSYFSLADQRSQKHCESLSIYPARELIVSEKVAKLAQDAANRFEWANESFISISQGEIFDGMESFLPFLTQDEKGFLGLISTDDHVVICDPSRITQRIDELHSEEKSLAETLSVTWDAPLSDAPSMFVDFDAQSRTLMKKTIWLDMASGPNDHVLSGIGFDAPRGDIEELVRRLKALSHNGLKVILVSPSHAGITRVEDQLSQYGLNIDVLDKVNFKNVVPGIYGVIADIENGFISHDFGFALISDSELAGHRHVRRTQRGSGRSITTYDDLNKGDYVVHHHHGVGVFEGLETKTMMDVTREYLVLSFKGSDKLFVPSDQVGLVRKYIGSDKPALHRLGGADFEKSRRSARAHVNLIAQELIVLYRKRLHAQGHAFSPDSTWQKEMEDLFEYELTADQKTTINEVKKDMERQHPMDRLVCGDVGFGKTEVAIRAAFKAVQDSKQVAIMVPTTLLATQHGHTFHQRFDSFGVRVEVLSRFRTKKEQTDVLDGLRDGNVDVVIGTHRLLSKDVKFKDLGLLIVDEEQRFGVSHKESIKHFATNVDVLTLSATPIPRTLEMSLTGIRDLSMITTPPADRLPILTYVHEYDERAVAEAIRRELLREGQVFFIHNRVQDLEHTADRIRDIVPEARIVTAHGQMSESKLEKIVEDFYDHKYDVLIATTIVESGLDLPAVNTLIVDRADALGLAQLYQLRGRVGRRGQRAYAYLFSPKNRALSHEAYERLKTIGEFNELGSGFKIAMRDLELRGAGSLLGDVQSGHVAAVGFDMYCEMVTEALGELNGIEPEEKQEVTIDLPVDALLSQEYIEKQDHRFDIYRRLSTLTSLDAVSAIADELADRFGPIPKETQNLLALTSLRVQCQNAGISSIISQGKKLRLVGRELPQSLQIRLKRLYTDSKYKPPHALGSAEIVVENYAEKGDIKFIEHLIADLFGESELA